jgi:diguanylate cyclase
MVSANNIRFAPRMPRVGRPTGVIGRYPGRIRYAVRGRPDGEGMTARQASTRRPDPRLPARSKAQRALARRAYPFRVLGMGLASLPIVVVMHGVQASWIAWVWMAATCFLWPHLAFLVATRSRDPFRAELRNMIADSAIAGSWVPLLHFNLLPSAVLLTVATADKINPGTRNLWLYSLPGMLFAMLLVAALTGFHVAPASSLAVIVSCLPILIIHTLAVSAGSYRLIRRVQMQNQRLEELSRIDALTGLYARGHWENLADVVLEQSAGTGAASLLLIDVDNFKGINDRHGHSVGDDVLRCIADLIRRNVPAGSHAGRLGGDEFAILVPLHAPAAAGTAERIREAVHHIDFPNTPGLRCTISIGMAGIPPAGSDLRRWIESADQALYRAKQSGRNRALSA